MGTVLPLRYASLDLRRLLCTSCSSHHPELLDEYGNIVNEPLLVMRSLTVQDAREQLDALYKSSPGGSDEGGELA